MTTWLSNINNAGLVLIAAYVLFIVYQVGWQRGAAFSRKLWLPVWRRAMEEKRTP